MAKDVEFSQRDLDLLEPLFERMRAKPGFIERMSKAQRWLVATPADGEADATIEFNIGERALNLVITTTGFEPGKALIPTLGERGVTTPTGWQLMADVGWVLGWRAPPDTRPAKVLEFGFKVIVTLGLEPPEQLWKGRVTGKPPRPGWNPED